MQTAAAALQAQLKAEGLDALIVNHDDEFLSFELTPECERIRFISGFSGSAGFVCISALPPKAGAHLTAADGHFMPIKKAAAVFTDGRYQLQVRAQTDPEVFECWNWPQYKPEDWCQAVLPAGSRIGIDLNCISAGSFKTLKDKLQAARLELVGLNFSLTDLIWSNRPAPVRSQAFIYDEKYCGKAASAKVHQICADLSARNFDAALVGGPDAVAWLLNLRGHDKHGLPVINARAVILKDEKVQLFAHPAQISDEVAAKLKQELPSLQILPPGDFTNALYDLGRQHYRVLADTNSSNAATVLALEQSGAQVSLGLGPCELPKAIKNETEIQGEIEAHLKDGIAMSRFSCKLKTASNQEKAAFNEAGLAKLAEDLRKEQAHYLEPSFDTISALGANAAVCHYNHVNAEKPAVFNPYNACYLIDSGAHYLEGTTDITRTFALNDHPDPELVRMSTLVLKGHIALATAIFPRGTCGMQLDVLARRALWNAGCDYAHGTGHGVGHLLSVHEGPQVISSHNSLIPLEPGMIISDEPGFYLTYRFGIRHENLLYVTKAETAGFLRFEMLTLVPFDLDLIEVSLLTQDEKAWLNSYHAMVYAKLKARGGLNVKELKWLQQACRAV